MALSRLILTCEFVLGKHYCLENMTRLFSLFSYDCLVHIIISSTKMCQRFCEHPYGAREEYSLYCPGIVTYNPDDTTAIRSLLSKKAKLAMLCVWVGHTLTHSLLSITATLANVCQLVYEADGAFLCDAAV